jgi:hypothetical protein
MSRFLKTDKLFRELILKERPHICEWCKKSPDSLTITDSYGIL